MELQILLAGVEFGPYSENKARQLLDEGFLSGSDPAKRVDEAEWLPLIEVLGVTAESAADGESPPPKIAPPDFRALAASLAAEPIEEFHAPLPEGSEVAEAPVEEPAEFSEEPAAEIASAASVPEVEPAPSPTAEVPEEDPEPAAVTETRKPNLTVSRPAVPTFRSTIPIPPRPATTSLPPPRLTTESKTATQSLRKLRRIEESDGSLAGIQPLPKPATAAIKSSFAAALAKTRSVSSGDTAPLPAPSRPYSGKFTPPAEAKSADDKPAATEPSEPKPVEDKLALPEAAPVRSFAPPQAPKIPTSSAGRVTSPIRAASFSATATSPLSPVTTTARTKKPTMTGSLLAKEALLRAREHTGMLGARMTVPLAPAADFEPEPAAPRKRAPVRLNTSGASAPPPVVELAPVQRKAIRFTGPISLTGTALKTEAELPASRLVTPRPGAPVIEAPASLVAEVAPKPVRSEPVRAEPVKIDPPPGAAAPAQKREESFTKPPIPARKVIRLTGPISLPGRATQPSPSASFSPSVSDTAPLTGLLTRMNRRGVALPVVKDEPKKAVEPPAQAEAAALPEVAKVEATPDEEPKQSPPPLRATLEEFKSSVVEAAQARPTPLIYPAEAAATASLAAETLDETEAGPDSDLTASGKLLSSGSLKVTGALKQFTTPRQPIRLSSPSGEAAPVPSPIDLAPDKPASPIPEEELASRAPSGKIPVHEFPTEGVKVRSARRLTAKVPLPDAPGESILAESPARHSPPPLPRKIELPGISLSELPAALESGTAVTTKQPAFSEPATSISAPIAEPMSLVKKSVELPVNPAIESAAKPAALPEPQTTDAPADSPEVAKPEKVRLRRPVKLELSSRKIEDSGRLTLEAFSKMASLPASEVAEAVTTETEVQAAPVADFSSRKLEEVPPLTWAPAGRRKTPGLEWVFYAIIAIGLLATAIIGYKVLHRARAATAEVPAETPSASNQTAASTEPPASATPPASIAPPADAVVSPLALTPPAPGPAVVTPPTTATPPDGASAAAPVADASTNAPTPVAPPPATNATTAPVPSPTSPAQDAAQKASAFVVDGTLEYQKGQFDDAITAYNQALAIDPKSTEALFNRGIAKAAHDDLDGAVADYTQALDIDPNMGAAYYYRGLARHSKAELDGAISDYNNAVRIDPKNALAFFNRGLIRMQKDDIDGAIVDSTKALELDPHLIQSYYDRGLGRMAKGDADGARTDMKQFTQLAPQDPYTDYARLYTWLIETQQHQLAEANKELGDAMNKNWNGAANGMVTRIGEFLLGQISESDLIKSSRSDIPLKDQGQRCEAWYFIGMRKLDAGDKDGATDALRKCVDTQKTDYCEFILAQEALKRMDPGAETGTPPLIPRAAPASLPDPGTMTPAPH